MKRLRLRPLLPSLRDQSPHERVKDPEATVFHSRLLLVLWLVMVLRGLCLPELWAGFRSGLGEK